MLLEAFRAVLDLDALPLLAATIFLAGLVRGFTGFGTALIFVPVAAAVLSPVQAVATTLIVDIPATLPLVPRALRDGDWREVARLLPGGLAGLGLGLLLLTRLDPVVFRWIICVTALAMLMALASGWRYRGALGRVGAATVGGAAGLFGGAAGAAGPPVILFYMGGVRGPAAIRANILMFLTSFGVIYVSVLAARGLIGAFPVALGATLVLPYALGGLIGQAVFDPARERLYRGIGYAVIAAAAISGLPVW